MIHIDLTNKRGSAKDKAMSEEEFNILKKKLSQKNNERERIILFLGARAGLRVSEIIQCRLEWLKIKEIGNKEVLEINIPNKDKDIKNKKKYWYVKNTSKEKKDKSRTTYMFNPEEFFEVYAFFLHNKNGVNYSRQHINTYIVGRSWTEILIRPRIKHLTAHSLRATAQNYLYYVKNLELKFISVALGHEDSRTTMKHYNSMNKASAESYLQGVFKK